MEKLLEPKSKPGKTNDHDLQLLASWMAGIFNNQAQARQTQTYAYVTLYMIPIWKDRNDGYWFYVEQSMADQPETPYYQRVYHLTRINEDLMESNLYTLQDAARFTRVYENLATFDELTPEMLVLSPGCSIILRRINESSFAGSTLGEGCPSELRGAMYTTSQIVINEHQIINWERGFDRNGKQVWGATMGGYIFSKIQAYEI